MRFDQHDKESIVRGFAGYDSKANASPELWFKVHEMTGQKQGPQTDYWRNIETGDQYHYKSIVICK